MMEANCGDFIVFLMSDPEHDDVTRQLVVACKQVSITHFILPRFIKKELCEMFGVKRLTSFGIDLRNNKEIKQSIC